MTLHQSIEHSIKLSVEGVLNSTRCRHLFVNANMDSAQERCKILDLGCGAGGSSFWAVKKYPKIVNMTGVTISRVQAELTNTESQRMGLDHMARFVEGSFEALDKTSVPANAFDGAFAIEAFVHSVHPDRFFLQVASRLKEGGTLIIVDDFLGTHSDATEAEEAGRIVNRFRKGWRASSVLRIERVEALARSAGLQLTSNLNLTPMLHLWRWRDHFIHMLVWTANLFPDFLSHWSEYFLSLSGGDALQIALDKKYVEYRMLKFTKA